MRYLIDGYNVLYAIGALTSRTGPQGLERARIRLIGALKGVFGDEVSQVTLVFDGDAAEEIEHSNGLEIRYTDRREEADDVIESLLGHDGAPRQVIIVSSDRRLQDAARKRHATCIRSEDFFDYLEKWRRERLARASRVEEKKPSGPIDRDYWMKEFGFSDDDAETQQLSGLGDFSKPIDDKPGTPDV
jgi:predicted RNA-binding protein with PIN domain